MSASNKWCPVSNTYHVSGTRRQIGAIGNPESFQEEFEAASSRDAYLKVKNKIGYEHVQVVAIKIKCIQCGECHVAVPSDLYLY